MPISIRTQSGANGTAAASWLTNASIYDWAAAMRSSSETPTFEALDALDDGARRQRAPGAHGDQRRALIRALQLVQRGGEQPAAGATHRMPQRDRAAVDVDPGHVGVVHPGPGQHHRRERLVDLDDVDVAHLHAGLLEHLRGGLH